ncbi:OmpA family protein [Stigmatella sp. ncwal1]|uniref:OmpA family protein n=1 Tax=Stigmatella ashevillensis TaxID=2995309 RepID=A0ABT5D9K6_9BACT|nr:OmpA family protein [Stigmatella ashevillena]MDC0709813.1 OmpA family protein [Stigmatella ashevillena]
MRHLLLSILCLLSVCIPAREAIAQQRQGFQLNRYEPTPPGETSLMVDAPRFEAGTFAVGLSLNYAYKPLVLGAENENGEFKTLRVLIAHQLLGSLDLAGSFCDCATFSLSIPLVLLERGGSAASTFPCASPTGSRAALAMIQAVAPLEQVAGMAPVRGISPSDPRLGMMFRLYGKPGKTPFFISAGGYLWIPLRKFLERGAAHTGDEEARILPKLVLGGYRRRLHWSLTGAFLLRPEAHLGTLPVPDGSTAGSEVQVGGSLRYVSPGGALAMGPEVQLGTLISPKGHAFKPFYTSLEALLGLHVDLSQRLQLGLAAGAGLLRQPGTPDFRFLFRFAYHSRPAGRIRPVPVRAVLEQDPDGDGVLGLKDHCPDTPQGEHPHPLQPGCPVPVPVPPPVSVSVPAPASSLVSVSIDSAPIPPVGDRDQDHIFDDVDSCPDQPGIPNPESQKHGCPGLVELKEGKLLFREPVVFATNTDTLLEESFPLLQAMADVLQGSPWIKRVRIEGHTDDQGFANFNTLLSIRRAQGVMRWLQAQGVAPERMEAEGYGESRPITSNDTPQGRATNRRVDVLILDPSPVQPAEANP